jgi:hypothetical protein
VPAIVPGARGRILLWSLWEVVEDRSCNVCLHVATRNATAFFNCTRKVWSSAQENTVGKVSLSKITEPVPFSCSLTVWTTMKVISYENSSELFKISFGISRRSGIIILSRRPATLREETIGPRGYISRVTAIRYSRHHANDSLLI